MMDFSQQLAELQDCKATPSFSKNFFRRNVNCAVPCRAELILFNLARSPFASNWIVVRQEVMKNSCGSSLHMQTSSLQHLRSNPDLGTSPRRRWLLERCPACDQG
jgi:hypothetical protein